MIEDYANRLVVDPFKGLRANDEIKAIEDKSKLPKSEQAFSRSITFGESSVKFVEPKLYDRIKEFLLKQAEAVINNDRQGRSDFKFIDIKHADNTESKYIGPAKKVDRENVPDTNDGAKGTLVEFAGKINKDLSTIKNIYWGEFKKGTPVGFGIRLTDSGSIVAAKFKRGAPYTEYYRMEPDGKLLYSSAIKAAVDEYKGSSKSGRVKTLSNFSLNGETFIQVKPNVFFKGELDEDKQTEGPVIIAPGNETAFVGSLSRAGLPVRGKLLGRVVEEGIFGEVTGYLKRGTKIFANGTKLDANWTKGFLRSQAIISLPGKEELVVDLPEGIEFNKKYTAAIKAKGFIVHLLVKFSPKNGVEIDLNKPCADDSLPSVCIEPAGTAVAVYNSGDAMFMDFDNPEFTEDLSNSLKDDLGQIDLQRTSFASLANDAKSRADERSKHPIANKLNAMKDKIKSDFDWLRKAGSVKANSLDYKRASEELQRRADKVIQKYQDSIAGRRAGIKVSKEMISNFNPPKIDNLGRKVLEVTQHLCYPAKHPTFYKQNIKDMCYQKFERRDGEGAKGDVLQYYNGAFKNNFICGNALMIDEVTNIKGDTIPVFRVSQGKWDKSRKTGFFTVYERHYGKVFFGNFKKGIANGKVREIDSTGSSVEYHVKNAPALDHDYVDKTKETLFVCKNYVSKNICLTAKQLIDRGIFGSSDSKYDVERFSYSYRHDGNHENKNYINYGVCSKGLLQGPCKLMVPDNGYSSLTYFIDDKFDFSRDFKFLSPSAYTVGKYRLAKEGEYDATDVKGTINAVLIAEGKSVMLSAQGIQVEGNFSAGKLNDDNAKITFTDSGEEVFVNAVDGKVLEVKTSDSKLTAAEINDYFPEAISIKPEFMNAGKEAA